MQAPSPVLSPAQVSGAVHAGFAHAWQSVAPAAPAQHCRQKPTFALLPTHVLQLLQKPAISQRSPGLPFGTQAPPVHE
jgi:hypothetical protein